MAHNDGSILSIQKVQTFKNIFIPIRLNLAATGCLAMVVDIFFYITTEWGTVVFPLDPEGWRQVRLPNT